MTNTVAAVAAERIPTEFAPTGKRSDVAALSARAPLPAGCSGSTSCPTRAACAIRAWLLRRRPGRRGVRRRIYLRAGANEGRRMLDLAIADGVGSSRTRPLDEPPVRRVRARPRVARPRAARDRRTDVSPSRSGGVQLRGRVDPPRIHRELDRQAARADRRLRRRHRAQPVHGDRAVLDPHHRARRARARRPGSRDRDPGAGHARFVRRRLLHHPEWDLNAWGVPISQSER